MKPARTFPAIVILLITAACLFRVSALTAQTMGNGKLSDVRKYDTIVYYGADFSRVKIDDADKIPKSAAYSKVYPAAWISYLENEMPADPRVRKMLGKPFFFYRQDEISALSVQVDSMFIISARTTIQADTLREMIGNYSLSKTTGLGLVLVAEHFSKPEEEAYTWVVFFDIASREIIYASRTTGKCGHMGYTAHWASGVIDGFRRFINSEYR